MNWQKIRELHPHNWVVLLALDGRTEKGQRIINQFALMDVCGEDWKAAWERYKELHAADKWKEYYVLHTDREELNIGVMDAFGRKVMDE
jgi:hypothetical protein